jgi:hypothetical protein
MSLQESGDEHVLEEITRAGERLFGVERQLERGRFAVPAMTIIVMEHHDEGSALRHLAARDDERLD